MTDHPHTPPAAAPRAARELSATIAAARATLNPRDADLERRSLEARALLGSDGARRALELERIQTDWESFSDKQRNAACRQYGRTDAMSHNSGTLRRMDRARWKRTAAAKREEPTDA